MTEDVTEDVIEAEPETPLPAELAPSEPALLLPPPRRPQTMTDQFLLRLVEELNKPLADTIHDGNSPCMELVPSYNAILGTAKANHPNDVFLSLLEPIEKDGFINTAQLMALFGQMRIVLESLQTAEQR